MRRLTAILFFLFAFGVAHADTFRGQVVAIADGDTLTLLDAAQRQQKIRLEGIDAPERRQPFGEASRQNLARLAFQKQAQADCPKRDRYGRLICTVYVEGTDVGLAQIEAGMAWWYRQYAREQLPKNRDWYEAAETRASIDRVGLWKDRDPVPPWEWRRTNSRR